jgi:hypothetical protein
MRHMSVRPASTVSLTVMVWLVAVQSRTEKVCVPGSALANEVVRWHDGGWQRIARGDPAR